MDRTHNSKAFRMLMVIDAYTHECLAIGTKRQLNSTDMRDSLKELFIQLVHPSMFVPIMGRSLLLWRNVNGCQQPG